MNSRGDFRRSALWGMDFVVILEPLGQLGHNGLRVGAAMTLRRRARHSSTTLLQCFGPSQIDQYPSATHRACSGLLLLHRMGVVDRHVEFVPFVLFMPAPGALDAHRDHHRKRRIILLCHAADCTGSAARGASPRSDRASELTRGIPSRHPRVSPPRAVILRSAACRSGRRGSGRSALAVHTSSWAVSWQLRSGMQGSVPRAGSAPVPVRRHSQRCIDHFH